MIQFAVCSIRILKFLHPPPCLAACVCLGPSRAPPCMVTLYWSPSSCAAPPPSVVTLSRSGGSPPPPAPGPPAAAGSRRSLCVRYLDMATSVWPVLAGRWRTYTGDGEPHQHGAHPNVHQHLYSTVQYNKVQYSTAQHSTAQYSTVQYSTV